MACKISPMTKLMDSFGMVYFFNPLYWIAYLQATRNTNCPWVPIRYECHGSAPADLADHALYPYGIDCILDYIIHACSGCDPYVIVQIRIPARMAWMGDALARMYARDTDIVIVSAPFLVRGKGGSDDLAKSGAPMWRPWGVPVKPKSFQGRILNRKSKSAVDAIERLRERRAQVAPPAEERKRPARGSRPARVRYRRLPDYSKEKSRQPGRPKQKRGAK